MCKELCSVSLASGVYEIRVLRRAEDIPIKLRGATNVLVLTKFNGNMKDGERYQKENGDG